MCEMKEYQRQLVEENLEIVYTIIYRNFRLAKGALLSYDDLYQVGCEALCRAAMDYRFEYGDFTPLGKRYVFNALVDHCRKENRVNKHNANYVDANGDKEFLFDAAPIIERNDEMIYSRDVHAALESCKSRYSGVILRGIEAMELKSIGYTTREIAEYHGSTVNNVNAWISKARAALRTDPVMRAVL